MTISELFLAQLEREAPISRRVLERVPEGRPDWKPHDKSMPMGYLATLVAAMPDWIALIVRQDSLDLKPPAGQGYRPPPTGTRSELLQAVDTTATRAREALRGTTDAHLMTTWRLLVAGQVVSETPRHVAIEDVFTHLAHHRGQLTVYLRLNDVPVPSVYGPTADDRSFG